MIISRTPYRISLGGGGTDLPFYSKDNGAFFISSAINEYLYVLVTKRPLDPFILTQTTYVQFSEKLTEIKDNYIREVLKYFNIKDSVQVGVYSTMPTSSGIGLGSSSSLTVGLIKALSKYKKLKLSNLKIARIAFKIEREVLAEPGGCQDQYISALGGIKKFIVNKKGNISYSNLKIPLSNMKKLEKKIVMVYSNKQRDSKKIIKSQTLNTNKAIKCYDKIKAIGKESEEYLINADIKSLGKMFNEHWEIKKTISNTISNNYIDQQYKEFLQNGAIGGKLIGAGGGGFFLLISDKSTNKLKKYLMNNDYVTLDWNFEMNGSLYLNN